MRKVAMRISFRSTAGPGDDLFAVRSRPDFYWSSHLERLHELLDLFGTVGFHDEKQGMFPVQDTIPFDSDAVFAGVHRAEMLQKKCALFRIFGRAGLFIVLVAYNIE